MVQIDLGTQGFADLQAGFEELSERAESGSVYEVEVGAEYAVYLEMGTRDMPPYPYFKPAITQLLANPEDFITDNTGYTDIEEIPTADELIRSIADSLEAQMKINATAETTGRSPGTAPEHPQVQTGNLRQSIKARKIK